MKPTIYCPAFAVCVALSVATAGASAQEHEHPPGQPTATEATAATPLYDNLGTSQHAITTTSPVAQQYFDQGLRLTYAFNHDEAIKSFKEGLKHDSTCAMCYWGVAYALGPNINLPMDTAAARPAYEAARTGTEILVEHHAQGAGVHRGAGQALLVRPVCQPRTARQRLGQGDR